MRPHFLLMLAILLGASWTAQAKDALVSDLSKNEVAIEANFTGETILLFGAIDTDTNDSVDLAVIVKGPNQPLTIRKKSRILGIWVNDAALNVPRVPAYYAVASNREISLIADDKTLALHGAGLKHLPIMTDNVTDKMTRAEQQQDFIDGLIRNKKQRQLYQEIADGVRIIDNRLFRVELALPPGVPIGEYEAQILLFRDGQLIGRAANKLNVGIQGFEQHLYRWAHELPALYGLTGVIISILCGWGAAVIFRSRA